MILETSIASMNVLYSFICDSYGQVAGKWNPVVDSTLAKIFRALSLVRNPTDFRRFPFELHQIIRSEIYFDKKNISGHNHIKSKIFPFIARIAEILKQYFREINVTSTRPTLSTTTQKFIRIIH